MPSCAFRLCTYAPCAFDHPWRYQCNHLAADDGASLGINACHLSALDAPIAAQDVFASVGLRDRFVLKAAMKVFSVAYGGMMAVGPAADRSFFSLFGGSFSRAATD